MRRSNGEGTIYLRKDGRFEVATYAKTNNGSERIRRYVHSRIEAEALLVELRKGTNFGLISNTVQVNIAMYLNNWLRSIKNNVKPLTYRSYESTVRLYLIPDLGAKYLAKLNVSDLQNFFDHQINMGQSKRTVQKQRIVLSAALQRAVAEELISRNVARLVKTPRYTPREVIPWTPDELNIFLNNARSSAFYPIFLLLSMYGLRTSEVLGLAWRDVDRLNNLLRIRKQFAIYRSRVRTG